MVKVYPAQAKCAYAGEYANLYVTKLLDGQSLYVFEFCKEVANYVYDTTGKYVPLIDTSNIVKGSRDSVTVFVPKDFNIPPGMKYVITELSFQGEE